MANKHIKRFSASLIISEMQIETTMRYHLIHIRMATIRKQKTVSVSKDIEKIGTLVHCWWECKMVQGLWKKYDSSSKNYKQNYHKI